MTDWLYYPLADSFDQNGDRHFKRGDAWLAAGYPDRAEGSYLKALKNKARASQLRAVLMQNGDDLLSRIIEREAQGFRREMELLLMRG